MTVQETLRLNQDYSNLLKEKLSLKIKFRLQKWLNDNEHIVKDITEQRSAIIKAIAPNGDIPGTLEDGTINPDFTKFSEQFNAVLLSEIDSPELVDLNLEDIENLETTQHFPAIFSCLS